MGKAFSEEEKQAIRNRLIEAGVSMFHDNSIKTINIRELTLRAGISQGEFYSFYKDKDEFVLDIMRYRLSQRIENAERVFSQSENDPAGFMSKVMIDFLIYMMPKTYSKMFNMSVKQSEKPGVRNITLFREFLEKLGDYWKEQNVPVEMDIEGMCGVMSGAFVLLVHCGMIDEAYFEEIFEAFIDTGVKKYLKETNAK